MANIQPRYDKTGKLISYSIRVHRGRGLDGRQLKPFTTTFPVKDSWTEKSARKKAEAFAATFERDCKAGIQSDTRQRFDAYCERIIELKKTRGMKQATLDSYRKLTSRIYPAIGHLKLNELRADHLNDLYTQLAQPGQHKRTAEGLSNRTIVEHHRLISTVLGEAVKEGLVPFNVAKRATLPKLERKKVNYFQPEQIAAIQDALETEPIMWKTMVHLMMVSGARRGEIVGLKWTNVDFSNNQIHICNNVLYSAEIGLYESSPKTADSNRLVALPDETMQLLAEYRKWQIKEQQRLGEYFQDHDFVFTKDDGNPINPNYVTSWLSRFSEHHGLPHINPHAFRHSMASMLYFAGADPVSISKRLGHSRISTTQDIYSHIIEEADQKNVDIISRVFLKKE